MCSTKMQCKCSVLVCGRHVSKMFETVFFEGVNELALPVSKYKLCVL